jgi:hypothetical protein
VKRLAAIEKALLASPDKQISLTDPDCRSMATSGRGYQTKRRELLIKIKLNWAAWQGCNTEALEG